jgi:hypothetical protein
VPVEKCVERKIVLPEPTTHKWNAGTGKVEGGPVLGGVDGLDAEAGLQLRVEIRDRRPPDIGTGRDIGLAAHQARRQRRHVPREREPN